MTWKSFHLFQVERVHTFFSKNKKEVFLRYYWMRIHYTSPYCIMTKSILPPYHSWNQTTNYSLHSIRAIGGNVKAAADFKRVVHGLKISCKSQDNTDEYRHIFIKIHLFEKKRNCTCEIFCPDCFKSGIKQILLFLFQLDYILYYKDHLHIHKCLFRGFVLRLMNVNLPLHKTHHSSISILS